MGEEDKIEDFQIKRSEPWPIAAKDSSVAFKLSESLSSFGSEMSFDSNCDKTDDDSRYSPLKEIQLKLLEEKKEDHKDIESSESNCKYSVFSSLRKSLDKEVYTGWSNEVLGESNETGWSETLKGKS